MAASLFHKGANPMIDVYYWPTPNGKKVTILAPTPVTVAEIDSLFRGALDSVGLTLERDGKFLYVIDAAKARHGNTPIVPAR